ncbi:MAG: hypothetical protein IJV15_08885 [Lachnospiraceae bacterium]|nr:hypothetical protein [Lachnospiraceae bacterium]
MQFVTKIQDKFTVKLQDMYSYSPVALIILTILILIPVIYFIVKIIISKNEAKPIEVNYAPVKDISDIKDKYNRLIMEIIDRYNAGEMSDKDAYQRLSSIIRHFVYDMTGIKVQNYTLSEIASVNIPQLYYLIDECYEPEFSTEIKRNILETCEKARKVIIEWN